MKAEQAFRGTSKYLLRNGGGGEGRGSVVSFQPAACSGSIPDSEHGPLTAVVVSVPDLYLTLSIHPELLHSMTHGWNSGCRSSHGNARSCLGDCSLISRKRAVAEAATLLKYTEILAHNVVVANEL